MTPDDPRHGNTAGYHAGCRDRCCRRAIARYEKEGRLARLRGGRAIPALGAQRRIQALMWLGWTSSDIADAAGWTHRNQVFRILKGQKGRPAAWLRRSTHDTVCEVFERLSMVVPEMHPWRARTREKARRKGWAPPLAWDDIDDPNERPNIGYRHDQDAVDEAAVERALGGDFAAATTQADRHEVIRRWKGGLADLGRQSGWNVWRYLKRVA